MTSQIEQCGEDAVMDALEASVLESKPSASVRVSPTEALDAVIDLVETMVFPVEQTDDHVLRTVGPVVPDVDPYVNTVHLVALTANLVDTNIDSVIPNTNLTTINVDSNCSQVIDREKNGFALLPNGPTQTKNAARVTKHRAVR